MINYRFTIDGNIIDEVDNIQGWDKLITTIKRDSSDLKGLLKTQDVKLVFIGKTYQFFYDKFYNAGTCNEIEILIEWQFDDTGFKPLHNGIIKIPSLELDEIKGECTTPIQDNSFYAKINNNKGIETVIDSGISKNQVTITPAPVYDVAVFDCTDGSSLGTAPMYYLFDAFKFLVEFMSDGEMGFESDFLQNDFLVFIGDGKALRTKSVTDPNWSVSFSKLFDNLKKNRDVSFQIEDAGGKQVLRIEKSDYFYQNQIVNTYTDPIKIKTTVDSKTLYSAVRFGSNPTLSFPFLSFLEDIKFNGFKEEVFHPLGQCNIDNELNLVRDIGVSSNLIQYILQQDGVGSPDTSYDENLIFIYASSVDSNLLTGTAMQSNPAGSGTPVFYNMELINAKVAESYQNSYQASLASYIGAQTNDFQATVQNSVSYSDVSTPAIPFGGAAYIFGNINYQSEIDPGNNFNLATDEYTVPVTGYYTFNLYYKYDISGLYSNFHQIDVKFKIDNIPGAEVSITHQLNSGNPGNGLNSGTLSINAYLTIGTILSTKFALGASGVFNQPIHQIFTLLPDTKFSATSTPDAGGIYQEVNQGNVRNIFHEIEYPITPQQFNDLISTGNSNFNMRGKQKIFWAEKNRFYEGWIDSYRYDHKSEIAKIIIKSTLNPTI